MIVDTIEHIAFKIHQKSRLLFTLLFMSPVIVWAIYMSYQMGMFKISYTMTIDWIMLPFGIVMAWLSGLIIFFMIKQARDGDDNVFLSMILIGPLSIAVYCILKGIGVVWMR